MADKPVGPEGVIKIDLEKGDGISKPKEGDTVLMHYRGGLKLNGNTVEEIFDSSFDRKTPFETKIGVGQVIQGWGRGVPQMSLGEKAILSIKSEYGYGTRGFPGSIPPDAHLYFEVELLKINGKGKGD